MNVNPLSDPPLAIDQLLGWIPDLLRACEQASDAILDVYRRGDFAIEQKSDHSPLTAADLASHRLLTAALNRLTPDIPVLSEESAEITYAERRHWPRLWVVDPLDGTREFIKRNGEFTINIALVENREAVLGVIAVPVEAAAYTGVRGYGARRWSGYHQPETIHTRTPCPQPPTILGSRSHGNAAVEAYFRQLDQQIGRYERIGAGSALKFCRVAEGSADFYPRLGPTSEWDTAAGHALVEAAGGRVWLADGRPMMYNARESLLNDSFLVAGDPTFDWPMPAPAAR